MKTSLKMFTIVLSAIALVNLVGCASETFHPIEKPIAIGDKTYTALVSERVQPWGTNGLTLSLAETQNQDVCQEPGVLLAGTTNIVSTNNASSTGLVVGALYGAVGGAVQGGMTIGAAAIIGHPRVTANGGNAAASSSSSSSATAVANH